MLPFINQISLNRYLILWKVNRPLVRLPRCLSVELSFVLGSIIAERLPTHQAQPWQKALAGWDKYVSAPADKKRGLAVPEVAWPLETVLWVYPGKLTYGQGELIPWELKLIGNSADHGLFLEVILPAMEQAGSTTDPRWHRAHSVWGRFDIQAVYAARGSAWEPVVRDGKLDLRYQATPTQWADGLTLGLHSERTLDRLTWLTPFDLPTGHGNASRTAAPTLQKILDALIVRISRFIPGKRKAVTDVWDVLSAEEQAALRDALKQTKLITIRRQDLQPAPRYWPGRWIGTQKFLFIPDTLVPYLDLAAILHIGKQTHFGCGTFMLT